MDSEAATARPGYPEIYVGPTCHVQTAANRFGPEVVDDIRTFLFSPSHDLDFPTDDDDELDSDEEGVDDDGDFDMYDFEVATAVPALETDPEHAEHGFPRIASSRNNLTALSQRYNLYFAAYQDHIYIYQPRAAPKILPAPSLVLRPRPSKMALCCNSVIDRRFGHQVNHIIVGNLGNLEIVLMAYDDGDVIAYYTHAIARCIKGSGDHPRGASACNTRPTTHVKPFFHDNVALTAWGLAIHSQSRLIAVGSNYHEVTVFAFAVSRSNVAVPDTEEVVDDSPAVASGQTALELEKHYRSRTRTWKITLPLGPSGHNVPNIDFVDDAIGEADKVAAIDIWGNVWLLDIWKVGSVPIQWQDDPGAGRGDMRGHVRGWGVLVLPDSSFRPTRNVRECLGLPVTEVLTPGFPEKRKTSWLDITCGLHYVEEQSLRPTRVLRQRAHVNYEGTHKGKPACKPEDEHSDTWESDSDDWDEPLSKSTRAGSTDETMGDSPDSDSGKERWPGVIRHLNMPHSKQYDFDDLFEDVQMARRIVPSFGDTPRLDGGNSEQILFGEMARTRQLRTRPTYFQEAELPDHLTKNFCLLRSSTTDIQIQPFDRKMTSVECNFVLPIHNRAATPWDMTSQFAERVSMLIHVPELNLVVAGSPTGRVALVALTRTARKIKTVPVRRGFRIDRILPRRDEDKTVRPACSLIGVAISPAPDCRARGVELFAGREGGQRVVPVKYRLIMHYKDHTILMYDIARGAGEDELMIF